MAMDLYFFLIPSFLLTLVLWKVLTKHHKNSLLPPGPPGLPIIGNLHQISSHHAHLSLYCLAKKYGPIIHLRLGQIPTVVISSAGLAKRLINDHDLALSSRPQIYTAKHLIYNCTDVAFAPYGPYWRGVRKLCTLELFSSRRVRSLAHVHQEEVARLARRIGSFYPKPVNLSEQLELYANDVICKAAFGRIFSGGGDHYHRHGFQDMLNTLQVMIGGFSVGDFFPSLEWINLITGMKWRLHRTFKRFDAFFDELIAEHLVPGGVASKSKDFVHILLESQKKNESSDLCLTMDNIKALILDIFVAGTDTSFTALDWGMTELITNQRVLEKAQKEVRNVMGERTWVSDSDIANMDYLKAVIKEVFRLHPPAPFFPRESIAEVEINGYKIPPKTRFFFNVWAIGRDPTCYSDPDEFRPERYLGSSVDYRGQDFELIPFGVGRRMCPAVMLAERTVMLALAQLLHSFDWELPSGVGAKDLDMTQVFGITMHRKEHLVLVAKPKFS